MDTHNNNRHEHKNDIVGCNWGCWALDFSLIKDLLIKIYLFFIIYFIFKKCQYIRIVIRLFNLQNSQANETRQEIPKFFLSLQGSQAIPFNNYRCH